MSLDTAHHQSVMESVGKYAPVLCGGGVCITWDSVELTIRLVVGILTIIALILRIKSDWQFKKKRKG